MIDEWLINTFGIVAQEFKSTCNVGFDFFIVCDTIQRAFGFLSDTKAQCSVELIDKLVTSQRGATNLKET